MAPLGEVDQAEFIRRFGIPVNTQQYGLTECFPVSMSKLDEETMPGSVGKPASYLEVEVHEEGVPVPAGAVGEIVVRPRRPGVMFDRYWGDPQKTLDAFEGLWYHTGDLGRFDEHGFLYYVDRKKDSMRRRGENVSAFELENILVAHVSIAEIAVHAVVVEGEVDDAIKACIVPTDASLSMEELADFFQKSLPYYAVPRFVELLDSLPRNVSGRVLKDVLRKEGLSATTIDLEAIGLGVSRDNRRGLRHRVPS